MSNDTTETSIEENIRVVKSANTAAKKKKKIISNVLELPLVCYKLTISDLMEVCKKFNPDYKQGVEIKSDLFKNINIVIKPDQLFEELSVTKKELGPEKTAELLTVMRKYEDQTVIEPPEDIDGEVPDEHLTEQNFDIKVLYALFYLYDEERYKYYKIQIAPSTIKKAGMGVYALEDIPEGAIGQYKGIPRVPDEANMYYSWAVMTYDPVEGYVVDDPDYMFYIDATNMERSNWTRYVNCGLRDKHNNMTQEQVYDKVFYTTIRDVKNGEELFIDYGEDYRVYNFGMKRGKY